VRFALNIRTAVLVTEPVPAVPSREAFTFAIVAASASNDASTSSIDWICEDESPEAFVATTGATEVVVAGTAVVAAVVAVVAAAAELLPEDEDEVVVTLLDDGLLPPVVAVEQSVAEGVIVTVTPVLGTYLRSDWLALQMSLAIPVSVLAESRSRPGAVTWNVDPDWSVTLKSVSFTVIESMMALVPDTFSVMPFTLRTVSVVRVTSSNAASARVGARSATRIPARASIRGIVSYLIG